jgi:hypothetical protein
MRSLTFQLLSVVVRHIEFRNGGQISKHKDKSLVIGENGEQTKPNSRAIMPLKLFANGKST